MKFILPGTGGLIPTDEAQTACLMLPEVGILLDWPGHSLAYVTDTTATPESTYIEKIRGGDVLLHDSNGPDHMKGLMTRIGHSSVSAAAQVAAMAQIGRLILVHRNPVESGL